jgi:predicted RNase H-like HicB family nuclease
MRLPAVIPYDISKKRFFSFPRWSMGARWRLGTKETTMEFKIFYKKKKDWFIGHIQEYPDYESQGKTLDELRGNLIEIYQDIHEGLVPEAEPFQLMEVAI